MAERRDPIPTPRQMIQRLRDGFSPELGGLNEDNANIYNCDDFPTQAYAQTCYDYCIS